MVGRLTEPAQGSVSSVALSTTRTPMRMLLGCFARGPLGVAGLTAALLFGSVAPSNAGEQIAMVTQYADVLGAANARLTTQARRDLAERVLLLTSYYRVDPRLLVAIVTVESSWRSRAVSPAGALGYGQLMPGTASMLRVDALEPYENLDGTVRYLRRLLKRYAGRDTDTQMRLTVASYNAGPNAVARYNGVPPYAETRRYVETVISRWRHLVSMLPLPGGGDEPPSGSARSQERHAKAVSVKSQRLASAALRPYHSPYLDATDPNSMPIETPAPVRYERSHSVFARILGIRHRVSESPATPSPVPSTPG